MTSPNPTLDDLLIDARSLRDSLAVSSWANEADVKVMDDLVAALKTAVAQVETLAGMTISNYIEAVEFDDLSDYQSWYHDSAGGWLRHAVLIAESSLKAIGIEDTEAYIEAERKILNENRYGSEDEEDEE